ncbi:MAG: DNA-3-methyladenine glycosylase [Planctomycetia bacterium]|nr:DNA-3-methyladenine glycosylase [Planctomycetia bacterium]
MPLPDLFSLPTPEAARALLGARLVHGAVAGTIVEAEAYAAEGDAACHAARGRTPRTEIFWAEGGLAYVYLCYGLHWCLNVTAHAPGRGGVVLLRAAAIERGEDIARARRGRADPAERLASGPARLTQAFGVTGAQNAADLRRGAFRIEPADRAPGPVASGPRVGITKAVWKRWRFWLRGHPSVSAIRGV